MISEPHPDDDLLAQHLYGEVERAQLAAAAAEPETAEDSADELVAMIDLLRAMEAHWMYVLHDGIEEDAWFKLKRYCEEREKIVRAELKAQQLTKTER